MRRRLNENCTLTDDDMAEKVMIDVPMPIDYISEHLIKELSILEPFGKGNEKPLFAERNLQLLSARVIGKNARAVKLQVMNRTGCQMEALYFGDPEVLRTRSRSGSTGKTKYRSFSGAKKTGPRWMSRIIRPSMNIRAERHSRS